MKYGIDLWKEARDKAIDMEGLISVLRGEGKKGPTLKIWRGKAKKPYSNYYYPSIEILEEAIENALAAARAHKTEMERRRTERKGTKEQIDAVKIGDIFHFSWGYDQTNVNFYQVIDKKNRTLTLKEIGQETVKSSGGGSGMSCHVTACKDSFLSDEKSFKKQLQFIGGTPYISIKSYGWCDLWDGSPTYKSWYA